MEMELKLMKEREREIAKSGGFTQLFNDDKDPSIHIQQLKVKYANMRKKMEDQILDLNDKKREIIGINVALKAKLNAIQEFEKAVYDKLKNLEKEKKSELNEKNSAFYDKDNERTNIEADNRLNNWVKPPLFAISRSRSFINFSSISMKYICFFKLSMKSFSIFDSSIFWFDLILEGVVVFFGRTASRFFHIVTFVLPT